MPKPKTTKTKFVVCRIMHPTEVDGHTVVVPAGARFAASDPIVKANPQCFEAKR